MSPLTLADLLLIAGRVLDLDTGEVLAITDLAAAEAALATAADAAGAPEQAAALLCELLWRRPFTRGNQRVAVVAALQQLATHGYELDTAPPQALPALVARITAGTTDREEVAAWLADRLLPRSSKEYSMFERLTGRGGKGPALFTRFTKLARQAVVDAQEEARRLEQDYVGTEHVLLGLIRQRDGIAAGALDACGVSLEAVRAEVEVIVGRGQGSPAGHIPFTPRAKKVLELSLREALQLGHNYIGTEHILLGLIREGEGVAAQVLVKLGADLPRVRQQVIQRVEEGPRLTAERKELLLGELASVFDDNERLRAEVQRLRDLLREHGVDPDNGASRTA